MAKVKFGSGVADIRGHVGGTVFSRNTSGAYIREKVTPVNPNTAAQQAVRSTLSDLSKAWATLTDIQRAGWKSLALAFPRTDIFGNPVPLTGIAQYQSTNGALANASFPRLNDPPVDLSIEDLATLSATLTAATRTLDLTFTPDPLAATIALYTFATPPHSPGRSFVGNLLRFVDASGVAAPSPRGIVLPSSFGVISVGSTITVSTSLIDSVKGAVSNGIQLRVTAV